MFEKTSTTALSYLYNTPAIGIVRQKDNNTLLTRCSETFVELVHHISSGIVTVMNLAPVVVRIQYLALGKW